MYYSAEDKWNDAPHMEHANHKYYMKIGNGPTARYFYSAQEYQAYQRGARKPSNMVNNLVSAFKNSGPRGVAAQRSRNEGDKQMRELRQRQANRIRGAENSSRVKSGSMSNQMNREARDMEREQKQRLATDRGRRIRGARQAAFDEAKRSAETRGQRMQQAQTRKKMQEAAKKRQAARDIHDAEVRKKTGRDNYNIYERTRTVNGKVVSRSGIGTYDVKRAVRKAGYKAKDAFNKVKKAANSSTAKKYKRKVKKTAQSAYKKGSNFVKKLLGR